MWELERTVVGGHKSVSQGLMQIQQTKGARAWKVWGISGWMFLFFIVGALDSTSHRVRLVFVGESRGDLVAENASQKILAFATLESIYSSEKSFVNLGQQCRIGRPIMLLIGSLATLLPVSHDIVR